MLYALPIYVSRDTPIVRSFLGSTSDSRRLYVLYMDASLALYDYIDLARMNIVSDHFDSAYLCLIIA